MQPDPSALSDHALFVQLAGSDPVLGEDALSALKARPPEKLIASFADWIKREDVTRHGQDRVALLVSHLGIEAVPKLIEIIENPDCAWQARRLAAACFQHLPRDAAAERIGALLDSDQLDVVRCAIEASGYANLDNLKDKIQKRTLESPITRRELQDHAMGALARFILLRKPGEGSAEDLAGLEHLVSSLQEYS